MVLRIFSSMTRQKEELVPLLPGKVGIYVCGVTPYDYSHVGHARAYVVFDTVVRWLRRSYQVTYVRNFTDVEDKIIKRARECGEEPLAFAERFAQAYLEDMAALGVARADVEPRVSTHMVEIIDFITALEAKGFAYRVPSSTAVAGAGFDVYFRVRKMDAARYLQLSGRSLDDMRAGARVAVDERKDDPLDFALWKSAKPGEISWDSPWGKGRPGWHIECSAMSEKHLGVTFDIHGGGKDLLFPHHTNEIAQSECRHDGAVMARIWMHNGFVNVESSDTSEVDAELVEEIVDEHGQRVKVVKMSKSLGNFFTIRDVFARFTPEALRTLLLSTHYRSPIAFSERLIEDAERRAQRLHETRRRVRRYLEKHPAEPGQTLAEVFARPGEPFTPLADFAEAMDDDFNTPRAFAAQHELVKIANLLVDGREVELIGKKLKPAQRAALLGEWTRTMEQLGAVLGVGEGDPEAFLQRQRTMRLQALGLSQAQVERLLEERAAAKAAKDFARADAARDTLGKLGIEVRDTPDGVEWNIAG